MDIREIGWKNVDCFHLTQDRVQLRALLNTEKNDGFHERTFS